MLDALLSLLKPNVEMPLGVDAGNDFTAFGSAFAVEVPYGLRDAATGAEMESSHALTLSVEDTAPASRLHAIVRGRLRFVAASGANPARLELRPLPIHLFLLKRNSHLSPLFKHVLYGNVEPSSASAAATALLTGQGIGAAEVTGQVAEFMAGARGLSVAPGDFIGRPAQDAGLGGRRRLELMFRDRDGFYMNPAHFLFQWPEINAALEGHPLLQALEPVQHRMIFASQTKNLYVFKNSPSPQPPYVTSQTAAHKIQDALDAAAAGDTVVVLDNATYSEKVTMKNGVKLSSAGGSKGPARVAANASLPTIECPVDGPAVTFEQLLHSHVSGFNITHAAGKQGSGVLVNNCQKVEVAKNIIRDNTTRRGAGVSVVNKCASIFIKQNIICRNAAHDGSNPALAPDRGQGGGILVNDSSDITVEDNAIYDNEAHNFGGGLALVKAKNVSVVGKNDIGVEPPAYAGSLGNVVTKDSPYELGTRGWLSYIQGKNPQGGGGGIGITQCFAVRVAGNNIRHNESSRGGGVEAYDINTGVRLAGNHITKNKARPVPDPDYLFGGDGGGVAVNMVSTTRMEADRHSAVALVNNIIEENTAGDDGGGVYGTGKALISITGDGHTIKNNKANYNGGGVRATFGSLVSIKGVKIADNGANESGADGGGGGVAFSNSSVKITDCEIVNNYVNDFAGGGVYLVTVEYFSLTGVMFEAVSTLAYQYAGSILMLEGCTVTGNYALHDRGAAGGLYVGYKKYPVVVKVKETVLSPNFAQHTDPNKCRNVVIVSTADPSKLENDDDLPSLLNPLTLDKTYTP